MKTVLEVNGIMNRGGAEIMLMDLVRKMHKDYHFIFLINHKKGEVPKGDFDDEIRSYGIPIYYIDAMWDVGLREYEKQFRLLLEKMGHIDIIHSHLNSKGGFVSRCAYKCGIGKRIVHSHANIRFDGSIISKIVNYSELYLQRIWINKYATDYWGCSEEALESLFSKRHRQSERAQVIHNAFDVERFSEFSGKTIREELGIPKSALVIGTVGRIAPVKNYEFAADIISELWKQGEDIHYVVAGRKQTDSSVGYLFNKLYNDSRFHYIGVREDLPSVYHGMDIYLGTSFREGLSLTAVEAQACGIPCVLSAGFPKLCDVRIGLVTFMDNWNAKKWADFIASHCVEMKRIEASKAEKAVKDAGFDITTEARKVSELYNARG